MTCKLTARSAESLAKRKGRWLDGGGLFLRTLEPGSKVYWVYRYRLGNRDREASVGSYPVTTLAQARIKHAELRAQVLKGIDPVGERRKAKAPKPMSDAASFGAFSDAYVERKEKRGELGKNPKHRQQWRNTLAKLPAWFRDLPVDEIGPQQIFKALDPIWMWTSGDPVEPVKKMLVSIRPQSRAAKKEENVSDLVELAQRFVALSGELAETRAAMKLLLLNGGGGKPDAPFVQPARQPGGSRPQKMALAQQAEREIVELLRATPGMGTAAVRAGDGLQGQYDGAAIAAPSGKGPDRAAGRAGWMQAPRLDRDRDRSDRSLPGGMHAVGPERQFLRSAD